MGTGVSFRNVGLDLIIPIEYLHKLSLGVKARQVLSMSDKFIGGHNKSP